MNAWIMLASFWAQITPTAASAPPAPGSGAGLTPLLPLRRWYSGLTLSTPGNVQTESWAGSLALGLAAMLIVIIAFQGPRRALLQLFDIPGLFKLVSSAVGRVRRSGRMLAVVVGMTVLSWTANQGLTYRWTQGRDDLDYLVKARPALPFAIETGSLAAMTPLRDIIALGNIIPLLVIGAVLVFRFSADHWGSVTRVISARTTRDAAWGTITWGAAALFAIYRTINLFYGSYDLPQANCVGLELAIVPLLIPVADGLMLAWVVVELRNANLRQDTDDDSLDVPGVVALMPAAAVACLFLIPARYVSTVVALASPYLLGGVAAGSKLASYFRWQLRWGIIDVQAAALVAIGMAGSLAWCRGTPVSLLAGYVRLMRAEGGRLLSLLIAGGSLIAISVAASQLVVLALPAQPWVLTAADSYSHYLSLPIGLVMLAGLVELGSRVVPTATLAFSEKES